MSHYRRNSYRQYVPAQKFASLTPMENALAFASSYHPALVAELKSRIPSTARRWEPDRKAWLVDTQYATVCADLAYQYLGIAVALPLQIDQPLPETRAVKLEYLGQAKDRGDGQSAYGFCDGGWNLVLPLEILQRWFEVDISRPGDATTLYSVLGVKRSAGPDEVKKAYRRLARQWHPDVCHESDAAEQFKTINNAYSVLSDARMRGRYDAGLAFQTTVKPETLTTTATGWRSPLRCGWLLVEGVESLGRFIVSKILMWEDVTDSLGRVMVSSWPAGGDMFEVKWY